VDFAGADFNADLRELPFSDNHADRACAIHVVEHFYEWEVDGLLSEWRRVIKPSGTLVLELPDMTKVLTYIAKCLSMNTPVSSHMSSLVFWGDPKHKDPKWCHKWGWTQSELTNRLLKVGFRSVESQEARYHFPVRDMRLVATK